LKGDGRLDTYEKFIIKIETYLMRKYGVDQASRDLYPIQWYVRTGRASMEFIKKLCNCKPFMIARLLHEDGSVDEQIKRVRDYVAEKGEK